MTVCRTGMKSFQDNVYNWDSDDPVYYELKNRLMTYKPHKPIRISMDGPKPVFMWCPKK
jgi:hypothetical protein